MPQNDHAEYHLAWRGRTAAGWGILDGIGYEGEEVDDCGDPQHVHFEVDVEDPAGVEGPAQG